LINDINYFFKCGELGNITMVKLLNNLFEILKHISELFF